MKKHNCYFFYGKTIWTDLEDGVMEIEYCPICGKKLGTNKPLTLGQLRKYNGKPVYVVCDEFPELNGWYIVHVDKQTQRIECWGYDGIKMDSINYGTWLAYLSEK